MKMPLSLAPICILLLPAIISSAEAAPPAPYGVLPEARHLAWHDLEFYGFVHFTTNTFTDKEWGYGDEAPSVFNPTDFDADQIASTFSAAGMKGLILTCKHHDGFCLWPSAYTKHDVAASAWRDGKGDVVREFADACARHGLKFGVYLSPWDRNHAEYGQEGYVTYYRNQIRELLTHYGPVFEVWFDGANGGDGYYGGAREERKIDRSTYYGWEANWALVHELAPQAVIFGDVGDVRWIGNESGRAGDPCWATYTPVPADGETKAVPGTAKYQLGETGTRNGQFWMPGEVDVSIRPGWFYHEKENGRVRTPENLVNLYFGSVGKGASLLLNVPPDRRGQIHEADVAALQGFRKRMDAIFAVDLAQGARVEASNVRGGAAEFSSERVIDGDRGTYWSTDDGETTPTLTIHFQKAQTFNVVSLREYLPLGQRIDDWALDALRDGAWSTFAEGTAMGPRRLWRGDRVTADAVRLRIVKSPVCPAISEIAVHLDPAQR
ncbi:MAG: alpha-L-fucosidase [Candidatus Hydrogenedentes bacterium]|nr:alpha-L-fucosidase [Candidatus Hydrogenedentota bacterium]